MAATSINTPLGRGFRAPEAKPIGIIDKPSHRYMRAEKLPSVFVRVLSFQHTCCVLGKRLVLSLALT